MTKASKCLMFAGLVMLASAVVAQSPSGNHAGGSASFKTPVTPSDQRIAQRAAELLRDPQKWNRDYVGDCSTDTSAKLTLYCSLEKAAREVSGKLDERSAVRQETRAVIAFIAPKGYGIDGYNGDPDVTFADVQEFFHILQTRLARRMVEQNPWAAKPAGGESEARPSVSPADLRIVRRAKQILDSPTKWNRADTRVCPDGAKTFSLYCALENATKEVVGKFEHRGAAMQESRFVIEDIAPNAAYYGHRLMDFNNDPATTFFDVQKFFKVLEDHISARLAQPAPTSKAAQ